MADPLDIQEDTAFSAALRWLSRPGYMARNVLKGDIGGAARQFGDLVLDPLDAILPGDVIPEVSKPTDYVEASDLVGGMDPGWGKFTVDVFGGMATDPLTYTGLGILTKPLATVAKGATSAAANLASKTAVGAKAVGAIEQGVSKAGTKLREATGSLRATPEIQQAVQTGESLGGATSKAATGYAVDAFKQYDPDTQRRAIEMVRGVTSEWDQGVYYSMNPVAHEGLDFLTREQQLQRISERVAQMPWSAAEKAAVQDAATKAHDFFSSQYKQAVGDSVLFRPKGVPEDAVPRDYMPGKYDMGDDVLEATGRPASPSLIKAKSITNPSDLANFLNHNKGALDTDLSMLTGQYGERMGRAAKQAAIGKALIPEWKSLAEDGAKLQERIKALRTAGDLDSAVVLETAVNGLPARDATWQLLANFNNYFKKFATGGAFIPKVAFNVRNAVSGIPMAAANPAARGAALSTAARTPATIAGALGDWMREVGLPVSKPEYVAEIENAIRTSGGSREAMLAAIKTPELQAAVRNGVLDAGFVNSEKLAATMEQAAKGPMNWKNLRDAPQAMSRGVEDRMRLGLFTDLLKSGMPEAQAAKVVKDSLYDYAYSSALNRTVRDVIPFFQFTAKAVPQQAKFLAGGGRLPSFARNLTEKLYAKDDSEILPPYLQGAPAINIGRDEQGNPQYLTSFGMPWEALQTIPNPSDDVMSFLKQTRQNVVGASTPILKTGLSAVMGVDPYFGTPFASFDKAPYALQAAGVPEHGDLGRIYNIAAGTGAIQPISSPLSVISSVMDPRTSVLESAANVATGVKVKSVDEDRALQQLVEEKLRNDPGIQRYEALFAYSPDPEQQQLLDELKRVKQQIRDKKKAAVRP